ncbi:hypothetical protein EB796_020022 [Bugula neritina]|uniref:Uncharacterized protein n=1 Tax=Bugula neritina TaxID=10212 RepID=A0A7J7J663_BUGNE|nr:hypothetical protein EB796_020022 [Bugula neritina]
MVFLGNTCKAKHFIVDQTQHHFRSLSSFKKEINSYLQTQLKTTTEKIDELYKVDKNIWRELDDQEQTCEKLVKQIRKLRKERIRQIKEESQELMQKVQGHRTKVTNQVEAFYNNLMLKRDELEKLQTEINRLLNADGNMAEKVKQTKIIPEKLNGIELGECFLSQPLSLIRSSDQSSTLIGASLVTIPSALTFLSEHKTNGQCYSAYHRQNGEILLGTEIGTRLLGRISKRPINYNKTDTSVAKVIEKNQTIYILQIEETTDKVEMCLSCDMANKHKLFQFERTSDSITSMAVSDKFVAVINPDTNQIILFDLITKQTEHFSLSFAVYDLQFLPDGNLLTVSGDTLFKFSIDNGNLTPIWACEEMVDSSGLCTDSNGLIYVTTCNSFKAMYIVSPEGELLQTLTHDKLPTNTAGVPSIQDGVLAIPGWDDNNLCLFKLEF